MAIRLHLGPGRQESETLVLIRKHASRVFSPIVSHHSCVLSVGWKQLDSMIPFTFFSKRLVPLLFLVLLSLSLTSAEQLRSGSRRGHNKWKRASTLSPDNAGQAALDRTRHSFLSTDDAGTGALDDVRHSPSSSRDSFQSALSSQEWSPGGSAPASPEGSAPDSLDDIAPASPGGSAPASPDSSPHASPGTSSPVSAGDSAPASPESIGSSGQSEGPSVSTSPGSPELPPKSSDKKRVRWSDSHYELSAPPRPPYVRIGPNDRLLFFPQGKDIRDKSEIQPESSFEAGESSTAAEVRAPAAQQPMEPPTALLAKNLPNGKPDLQLQEASNQHIRDVINALPEYSKDRKEFVLVDMPDVTAPGGHRVFRFYNRPGEIIYSESVDYVPNIINHVKAAEEAEENPGWRWKHRPATTIPDGTSFVSPVPEEDAAAATNNGGMKAKLTSLKQKLAPIQQKLRTKYLDAKDVLAVGLDRKLENYYTTGGIPAIYGREEIGIGHTIPVEARRIAQKMGEARIFYDPSNPDNQVRLVYTGPKLPPGELADEKNFKTYKVPADRALPLPRDWRNQKMPYTHALNLMKDAEAGSYNWNGPDRWPKKVAEWRRETMWSAKQKVKAGWTATRQAGGAAMNKAGLSGAWAKAKGANAIAMDKVKSGLGSAWEGTRNAYGVVTDKVKGWMKSGTPPAVERATEMVGVAHRRR